MAISFQALLITKVLTVQGQIQKSQLWSPPLKQFLSVKEEVGHKCKVSPVFLKSVIYDLIYLH